MPTLAIECVPQVYNWTRHSLDKGQLVKPLYKGHAPSIKDKSLFIIGSYIGLERICNVQQESQLFLSHYNTAPEGCSNKLIISVFYFLFCVCMYKIILKYWKCSEKSYECLKNGTFTSNSPVLMITVWHPAISWKCPSISILLGHVLHY